MLRLEVDGHFHGGPPVKPWVARIGLPSERWGLEREFIQPMNDWKSARRANSGNLYGVVATFVLREGELYEVQRCRGNSSKRHVVREFRWIEGGKQHERTPDEALAWAEAQAEPKRADEPAVVLRVRETQDRPWVAEVTGIGTPKRLGFVVDASAGERRYRVREGHLYEVREIDARDRERRSIVQAVSGSLVYLSQEEAFAWLKQAG